jgi:hypothetical protein
MLCHKFLNLLQSFYMPTDQQEAYRIIASPPKPPNVFATKIPSTVTFAIGLLLFILPFAELKCKLPAEKQNKLLELTDMKLSFTNTGLGLALGNDWKLNMPVGDILQNQQADLRQKQMKQKPNYYAITALAMAVLGLGLSFMNAKQVTVIAAVAGGIATGALIGLMMDLNTKSKDIISEMQNAGNDFNAEVHPNLSLTFTPWFFIVIIALLAATVFSYMRILSAKP